MSTEQQPLRARIAQDIRDAQMHYPAHQWADAAAAKAIQRVYEALAAQRATAPETSEGEAA